MGSQAELIRGAASLGVCVRPFVCPSGPGRRLLGSFALGPVSFAIHLLVRAFAGSFPGHSARHNERQVPAPGMEWAQGQSGALGLQHARKHPERGLNPNPQPQIPGQVRGKEQLDRCCVGSSAPNSECL